MIRRAVIVAALTVGFGLASAPAQASSSALIPRGDTNGCVVVKPVHVAVCLGRF